MKSELIEKLEGLLAEADISAVAPRIKSIQREYEQLFQKDLDKARQEFVDEGGKARDFVYAKTPEDEKIIQLLEQFRKKKKDADARLADEQTKNLEAKREIIKEINDLTQISTNVGTALKKLTELQGKWKDVGPVSPHVYKDLQAEYSKAVENFNYNLSIYRALQEHDLKKNEELKKEIIDKLKKLDEVESVKEVERLIKIYRNEWDEVGPVQNDKWEGLKSEYKAALDHAYARVKEYYKSREEESEKNLLQKKEIASKAAEIAAKEYSSEDEWQKRTEEIIALQDKWKTVGKADQKKSDAVWASFREQCDLFFTKKKEFYAGLKERYSEARTVKMKLIEEAEKLQTSTDWKDTSDKLIQLQNRWKKAPPVAQHEEHRLFFRFRKACNTFFEAKRAHFEAVDNQYADNLKAKEEILERINAFQLSGDASADRNSLKSFADEWNKAGLVPFKEKKRVNDAFYGKLDELFEKLNVSAEEKAQVKFQNKIERLISSDGGEQSLIRESEHFRKQVDEINKSINTYENNLGFFKHAKTKNAIMIEIEEKIVSEKKRLEDIRKKQSAIREALRKLKEQNSQTQNQPAE